MSEAEASVQVEIESGKRVKVKLANVLMKFAEPQPAAFIAEAQALAAEMDLDLAWEFAPADEFAYPELAREYFSGKPENFNRPDHAFKLVGADRENTVDDCAEPRGDERAGQRQAT